MSFVFTERVVNIVPGHRVSEELDTELFVPERKLTRKTKVLQVSNMRPNTTIKRKSSFQSGKESVTAGQCIVKQNIVKHDKHNSLKTRDIDALNDKLGSKPSQKMLEGNNVPPQDDIIRSKLLAQRDKEKSLRIQKYILEGKKKRLAQIREERDKKEAQRMELQKKLNALNDYRRSRFKVLSNQKVKESQEVDSNQIVSDGFVNTLDQKVDQVEYDLSSIKDCEKVSNISHDQVSTTSTGIVFF
jgi:hypothetical protein